MLPIDKCPFQAEYVPRAESIAAANYLNHKVVEDRFADRLKVVNFQPVKDESKSSEEMTASGVAVSVYVYGLNERWGQSRWWVS